MAFSVSALYFIETKIKISTCKNKNVDIYKGTTDLFICTNASILVKCDNQQKPQDVLYVIRWSRHGKCPDTIVKLSANKIFKMSTKKLSKFTEEMLVESQIKESGWEANENPVFY